MMKWLRSLRCRLLRGHSFTVWGLYDDIDGNTVHVSPPRWVRWCRHCPKVETEAHQPGAGAADLPQR
jgi:hypothetical protein